MEVDSVEKKEDGWSLIVETEYSLGKIRDYIKSSCIAEKCAFIDQIDSVKDDDVEKLCAGIIATLSEETTLEELTALLVVSCMLYTLEGASVESIHRRINVLYGVVFHTDTLGPHHIHIFVQNIWDNLKIADDTSFVMNILALCREFCVINASGKGIAICLAWSILAQITETEIEMFRFHEFSEINAMLKEIDEDILRFDESTKIVYILIQVVGFLINAIVFGSNEKFIQIGFGNYFKYQRKDLVLLKEWAEHLADSLGESASKPGNYWDLRMSMTEYVKMNVISLLYDKIRDMDE